MTVDFFRSSLFAWAAANPRPMPWKGEKDPYKIWLSEIILQQTRVEQGLPYFEKFVATYPTVLDLAVAPEDAVLKLWEGLGYYTRARNLHAAAKHIAQELGGVFPTTYEGIRELKGVGDYTAAAIASFAYNLPHAVLDGNVYRVLSRYFAIETPTDLPAAKKEFAALADSMLDKAQPAAFNQALMDFGALCCTPAQPGCRNCPMQPNCQAARENRVAAFPVRAKKMEKKARFFLYVVVEQGADTYLRKRAGKDIWRGLYEYPMLEVESANGLAPEAILSRFYPVGLPNGAVFGKISPHFKQILTHQLVLAAFLELHLPVETKPDFFDNELFKSSFNTAINDVKKKFAFPRVVLRFLEKNV